MRRSRLLVFGFAIALPAILLVGAFVARATAGLSRSDLSLIAGVIELIQQDYVRPVDSDRLTQDTLKGLLSRLDPHSGYMDEQELREMDDEMSGKFGGIGVEIEDQSGIPMVISPIDGTPAANAGLQPGDRIISVDAKATDGMDATQVVRAIRGKAGSSVTLTILRGSDKPFDVTVTRSIIQVHTVTAKLEPNGFGYVRISQFGSDTQRDFKQSIAKLKQDAGGRLRGLVLDLRNDPGWLLQSAVEISGDFLDGGTVVSIHGRRSSDDQTFSAPAHGDLLAGTPVVVLINGASASASEIVSGALQDRHRATVIGTQSFGKGSVQTVIPLNGHGALRLTTALYYTPSGRSIQGDGISPDTVVEAPKDQQTGGATLMRESQLHGALTNPGPLGKSDSSAKSTSRRVGYSAPIKTELLGTPQDAQLQAALAHLERTVQSRL
jgi:carboxyl-terminal processing protease